MMTSVPRRQEGSVLALQRVEQDVCSLGRRWEDEETREEGGNALSTWKARAWAGERRAAARAATSDERANMARGGRAGWGRGERERRAKGAGRGRRLWLALRQPLSTGSASC